MAAKSVFTKKETATILTKRTREEKIVFAIVGALFMLHALTFILALAWMFLSSLKETNEFAGGNPLALPEHWLFSNYAAAFRLLNLGENSFFNLIFNSLWYTIIIAGFGAFVPAVTGYIISKYNFKAKPVIFALAISSMVIPIVGNTASYMRLVNLIGIYDTPLYVVTAGLGGFGGSFLVYYGYFKSVSWNYAEAAMIDGAGNYQIFFRIMLPQAVPIMLTYCITGAIAAWNEYQNIILFLPSYPTLASGLYEYQAVAIRNISYPVYYAGLIISMIPTILLFGIFSNRIMSTVSLGGLKG